MKKLLFAILVAGAAGAGGCYADAGYGYGGETTAVGVASPNMVYVDGSPGVQVVTDYDYPVFYSDNLYWRYDGGTWYSSRWHDRGWGRNYNVPVGVRGISRPEGYAHYRGGANYRGNNGRYETHQPGGGGYRGNAPVVRDRRSEPAARPVVRDHRTEPARSAPSHPVVRDHRSEHH